MNKIWLILITLAIVFVSVGSYIPHNTSKHNNFIGVVGGHIYVDNSSQKEILPENLEILWRSFHRGAPGPILLLGKMNTQRIEVLDANIDRIQHCGNFKINAYSFFDFLSFSNLEIAYDCA